MKVVVVNLLRREDRRRENEHELARIGWAADFFPAIEPTDAGDFPSRGARGCFLSHLAVLKAASGPVVILEDDVGFLTGFSVMWEVAEANPTWSIYYPFGGLAPGLAPMAPSEGIRGTHCVAFRDPARIAAGLEKILSRPAGHPMGGPMHVDGAYSTLRQQDASLVTFAHSPALAHQRSSRSDIAERRWFDRGALAPVVGMARRLRA